MKRNAFRCVLLVALVASIGVRAGETLVDVNFASLGPAQSVKKKGSFEGPLPANVKADFYGWNTSEVTARAMSADGRKFTRFDVKKLDHSVLFRLDGKKITVPGYYQLQVTCRCPDAPLNLHIRQKPSPYKTFDEASAEKDAKWREYTFELCLKNKKSRKTNKPLDTSNMGLFLSLPLGITDIASVKLSVSDEKTYLAFHAASIERPKVEPVNYFRNSRFPLGPQTGWSKWRQDVAGTMAADSQNPGPSGFPSLKIQSNGDRVMIYSEPFQVKDPSKKVHVSFACQAKGAWKVKIDGVREDIPESAKWETVKLTFQPKVLDKGYYLTFTGNGTLSIDSLMAYSGDEQRAYASDGACEIALASTAGDDGLAETRVQFIDQPATVKFTATGDIEGATLKATVTNVYGATRSLSDTNLGRSLLDKLLFLSAPKSESGELDFDEFSDAPFGPFRIEVWAERDGKRVSPYNEIIITRVRRPIYWGKDAPNSPFGGHFLDDPRVLKTMKAVGINWARFNDANMQCTCWGWLEQEKGKWTFRDKTVKAYRDANLKILGQIGTAPTWASYYHGEQSRGYSNFTYQPKDIEAFKNYVRVVATHYQGLIDEYQFQNEPWGGFFWHKSYDPKTGKFGQGETAARDYAELSKVAYKELKKVYPEATMYGFNTLGGKKGEKWTKELFDDGAYDYCDMIDYHKYNGEAERTGELSLVPDDTVEKRYQQAVGYIKEHVTPPMKPVVNSEGNPTKGGAVPEGCKGKDDYTGLIKRALPYTANTDNIKLANIACRFIADHLTLPVKRIFLYSDHCYHRLLHPPSFTVMLGADGYVHPVAAAFSNLAWLLEDRPFAERFKIGDNVWAYIFCGRGQTVAIISGLANGRYAAPTDQDLEYLDLFGNPISGQPEYNGNIFYAIDSDTPEALAAKLKR